MRANLGRVMLYTGIDYHKKYSVASTFDAAGARVKEARIDGNEPAAFAAYFRSLPQASAVGVEAARPRGSACYMLVDTSCKTGAWEGVKPRNETEAV